MYKCQECGGTPTATVRSRVHEGPVINIKHCHSWIADLTSYWHYSDDTRGESLRGVSSTQ